MDSYSVEAAARQLGGRIADARRILGITQQTVALLAGVSERSVRALEAGKPTVRLDIVLPVLHVLGLDLAAAEDAA